MPSVIRAKNLSLRYNNSKPVLRDVNFELAVGAFRFLTGASGAGKSSLINLLNLTLQPSGGELFIFDNNTQQMTPDQRAITRQNLGVVFQDFRLLHHLTLYDNVALPMRLKGKDESYIKQMVIELIEWIGLKDRLFDTPPTLSGGEQQRVAIARAVVANPRLILADEPTGHVEPDMAYRIMFLLETLNKQGTAIIFTTHNTELLVKYNYPEWRLLNGQLSELS